LDNILIFLSYSTFYRGAYSGTVSQIIFKHEFLKTDNSKSEVVIGGGSAGEYSVLGSIHLWRGKG